MPMNRTLPAYLDLLRFGSAVVVFLSHAGTRRISGGLLHQFESFGPAAVDVFFVLSGLVIANAAATRDTVARRFVANRAGRLYSVVLPALLVGMLLDMLGAAADPALYAGLDHYHPGIWLPQLLTSLTFGNEVWFAAIVPGSNLPYWSLGFEAWYYAAYAMALFAPPGWRWAGVALVLLAAGPKIAMLFPLWLLGVACWHVCRADRVGPKLGWLLLLGPPAALLLLGVDHTRADWPYNHFRWEWQFLLDTRWDYAVGVALAAHLVGLNAVSAQLAAVPERAVRLARGLAGGTFTLYLLHYPLIHFLVAVLPWPPAAWPTRLAVFVLAPALLLGFARVIEPRGAMWRRLLSWRPRPPLGHEQKQAGGQN